MAGEPNLEKVMQDTHEEMRKLKQKERPIFSAAVVKAPYTFTKPLAYPPESVVQAQHPTIRAYESMTGTTETDLEFALYPAERER